MSEVWLWLACTITTSQQKPQWINLVLLDLIFMKFRELHSPRICVFARGASDTAHGAMERWPKRHGNSLGAWFDEELQVLWLSAHLRASQQSTAPLTFGLVTFWFRIRARRPPEGWAVTLTGPGNKASLRIKSRIGRFIAAQDVNLSPIPMNCL